MISSQIFTRTHDTVCWLACDKIFPSPVMIKKSEFPAAVGYMGYLSPYGRKKVIKCDSSILRYCSCCYPGTYRRLAAHRKHPKFTCEEAGMDREMLRRRGKGWYEGTEEGGREKERNRVGGHSSWLVFPCHYPWLLFQSALFDESQIVH